MQPLRRAALLAGASLLAAATCQKPPPSAKDLDNSRIHYDLGVNAQQAGDVRSAVNEFETSLKYSPDNEKSEDALGVLYHLSFRKLQEAERHYKRALAIKSNYSEAKVNLGNLYIDEGRYDEAIALYEQVLKDMFYRKPWLPENNEGWALYKKGSVDEALAMIAEAVRANPEFCQGYRNLGLIYLDQGKLDLAHTEMERVVVKCPDMPEGYYQLAVVLLKQQQEPEARANLSLCREKAKEGDPLLEECARLLGNGPQ